MDDLRKQLGIEDDRPIPADYNIPYFVHQENMNRMDMSHKRAERWLGILCIIIFIALIGTNGAWMYYESQFQDYVTEEYTAETDQGGTAIANGDGSVVVNGESNIQKDN